MFRSITYFAVFALITVSLSARDLPFILKDRKIKVAVDTTYPPMEFESADGKIIGLDIDLATELAKNLGVTAEFVVMPWDGILAGLSSDRYDIIMSSMNITDERKKQVDFVPYITMGQVFISKVSGAKVKTEKDLAGKVVAVQADTTSYEALLKFKNNGIKIKDIKAFKGATDAFSALKSGQAEAILIDEAVGYYYAGLDSKTFEISGHALKPEPIGIAVRKSDKELFKALTSAMKKMKDTNSFHKIYKSWLKVDPR